MKEKFLRSLFLRLPKLVATRASDQYERALVCVWRGDPGRVWRGLGERQRGRDRYRHTQTD